MSGKSIRRRAKLVKEANQGNLAKAQRGRASANLPLPSAPTKDDYVEKMPSSLRRMMALKAAAAQPPAIKQKLEQQQQKPGATLPQGKAAQQQQQPSHGSASQQDAKSQQKNRAGAAGGSAGAAPAAAAAAAAAATGASAASGGVSWEQPKKLKQRRKEYLNAKKLKKKGKRPSTDQQLDVDRPAFGEVVHAPPKVHLKRKHWDPAANKAAQDQQQYQQAGRQQQQQRQKQKQQTPAAKRQKQLQDPALLELREQAIEGYRAGRGPREGHATLGSLRQLVK